MADVNIYIENIYINPPKDETPVVINEWPEPPYDPSWEEFPEEVKEAEVELYEPTKNDEFKVGDRVIFVGDDVDYEEKPLFLAYATVTQVDGRNTYLIDFDLDEEVSCWGDDHNRWAVKGVDLVKA